jgi:hypothetical protein
VNLAAKEFTSSKEENLMAKKTEVGGFISPANLWGKPLPNLSGSKPAPATNEQKEERTKRMLADEDDTSDSDVDAELEEDDAAAYAEAAAEEADEPEDAEDAEDADDDEEVDGYESEEGDDADDGEEVDATVAVASDDPAPVPVTASAKKKVSPMSEKKSGADHIRDEIAKRQAAGESLRGVDIVAALAKRRIEVSPAQVSQLLKKAGAGGAPRGKKLVAAGDEGKSRIANKAKKPTAETPRMLPKGRPATGAVGTLPMDQLKAASAFLAACGGCYDSAGEILSAHKQLGAMMAN